MFGLTHDVDFSDLFKIVNRGDWRKKYQRYLLGDRDQFAHLETLEVVCPPVKGLDGLWEVNADLFIGNEEVIPIILMWKERVHEDGVELKVSFPVQGSVTCEVTPFIIVQSVDDGIRDAYMHFQQMSGGPVIGIWL